MFPDGVMCKGRGFNCGGCKNKNTCEQYVEPKIEDIPVLSLRPTIDYNRGYVDGFKEGYNKALGGIQILLARRLDPITMMVSVDEFERIRKEGI